MATVSLTRIDPLSTVSVSTEYALKYVQELFSQHPHVQIIQHFVYVEQLFQLHDKHSDEHQAYGTLPKSQGCWEGVGRWLRVYRKNVSRVFLESKFSTVMAGKYIHLPLLHNHTKKWQLQYCVLILLSLLLSAFLVYQMWSDRIERMVVQGMPNITAIHDDQDNRINNATQNIIEEQQQNLIPYHLHNVFTSKANGDPPQGVMENVEKWALVNPGIELSMWGHNAETEIVAKFFMNYLAYYVKLPRPILQSDIIRYMIIAVFGGIYADNDVTPIVAFHEWKQLDFNERLYFDKQNHTLLNNELSSADVVAQPVRVILGIEFDCKRGQMSFTAKYKLRNIYRNPQICQWTFASTAGHPLFYHIVDVIMTKIASFSDEELLVFDVIELTGPAIFTDAVRSFLYKNHGFDSWDHFLNLQTSLQIGDILILPVDAFGSGSMNVEFDASKRLVQHHFKGSWK